MTQGLKNLGSTVGDEHPVLKKWTASPFSVLGVDTQKLRTEMIEFLDCQFSTYPDKPWQRFRDIKSSLTS